MHTTVSNRRSALLKAAALLSLALLGALLAAGGPAELPPGLAESLAPPPGYRLVLQVLPAEEGQGAPAGWIMAAPAP